MRAAPLVANAEYSVAVGRTGEELVPTMVFDDGRATYFRFSGNRPLPAVFMTTADGAEESVNARMTEDGLLVVDRVVKRFVLRAGDAVAALINEAYVRLVDVDAPPQWDSRGHFFAAAAEAMRRILIDHARERNAQKRGGEFVRVDLADELIPDRPKAERLLALARMAFESSAPQDTSTTEARPPASAAPPSDPHRPHSR